jgi:hypothetical protein
MPTVFTFSEAGGHPHNEDSFGGRPHPDDERVLVCAIADGVGGQPKGGPAARLAVRTALDAPTDLLAGLDPLARHPAAGGRHGSRRRRCGLDDAGRVRGAGRSGQRSLERR